MDIQSATVDAPSTSHRTVNCTIDGLVTACNEQSSHEVAQWIAQGRRRSFVGTCWSAMAAFWGSYVGRLHCLRGGVGVATSYLRALRHIMSYAKYWESVHPVDGADASTPVASEGYPADRSVPVSIVIITKNESTRIRPCLASVAWAKEVLVVDDESTDDTCAIAASMGAVVHHRKMDNEGHHRNWAYAQATEPWVLSLDADERMTPEASHDAAQVIADDPTEESFDIPRRNYIGKRWLRRSGWYPSAQLRLFRYGFFTYEEMEVHPRAIYVGTQTGCLQHAMEHYSYRDVGDFLTKVNTQSTREAEKWVREGRRVSFLKAMWRAIDRGIRSYVRKGGYLDGFLGLMVAEFSVAYQLLSYAKYREMRTLDAAPPAR